MNMRMLYIYTQLNATYRKTSNISRTLVDNTIVEHSDVVYIFIIDLAPGFNGLGEDWLIHKILAKRN